MQACRQRTAGLVPVAGFNLGHKNSIGPGRASAPALSGLRRHQDPSSIYCAWISRAGRFGETLAVASRAWACLSFFCT